MPPAVTCPNCSTPASGHFCANCGTPLGGARCAECGTLLSAGAKFCHRCGTAVGSAPAQRAASSGLSGALPWAVAGIALVALIALVAGQRFGGRPAASEAGGAAVSAAQPADGGGGGAGADVVFPPAQRAPDISQLPPRERAIRLFNRVMSYAERGKTDSMQFFAPMAISAYQMLPELDSDARYDMGRVAEVAGDLQLARAQADTILRESPSHLLGLILAARVATLGGDEGRARELGARLLAAVDEERRKNLPEYQVHQADIEKAVAEARGGGR